MGVRKLISYIGKITFLLIFLSSSAIAQKSKEITFAKICWSSDGIAEYPTNKEKDQISKACKKPVEIIWPQDRLPIRVQTNISDLAIDLAMLKWNHIAGKEIFVFAKYAPDVVVSSKINENQTAMTAATLHALDAGNHLVSSIFVYKDILNHNFSVRFDVYFHEFGHVLGLGHDIDDKTSIMHPNVAGDDLTEADKKAIRKRYGKN